LADGGQVSFGSFRGGLPIMDFGPVPHGKLWQLVHKKRWVYAAIADESVFAGVAVVSLGYAATAIVFVLDRRSGTMLFDESFLAPGTAVTFSDEGSSRRSARFEAGRTRVDVGDEGVVVDVTREVGGRTLPTHVSVRAASAGAPPPISAVVPVEGGYANATEKSLADASGEIVAGGRRYLLDRPLIGFDHTCGYLARHTAWRWGFALGRTSSGQRVGFNVVEGFVGEAECGAWVDDELFPLGEARFEYDVARPDLPWRLKTTCGGLDLSFSPAAVHHEDKDMLVVRSKFVQPVGAFDGRLCVGGKTIEVRGLPGVTEHQDVLW
jgi:hypothetical protein